ncbi:MAG: WYL domain-containing protein [Clostridia bacterium]|nr:WYL domain-containing protein [Clostridia bacterium]
MSEVKGKKALSLCILRVLEQHANKTDPLSTRRIIEFLEKDHGMIAERKAVGRNLLLLQEMGFPLSAYQENGKGYYLKTETAAAHEHDPAALDAYLRAPRSDRTEAEIVRLQDSVPVYVSDAERMKQSETVFDTLDLLKKAIEKKVQVSFLYAVVEKDGSRSPQRETPFTVSPYALFLAEGYYYVIVSVSGYGRLLHYRCDLMEEVTLSDVPAREAETLIECRDGLDIAAYVNRTIYRTDVMERHTVLCAGNLAGELIDTFGDAVKMRPEGETIRAEIDAPWEMVHRFLVGNLKHTTLLAPAWRRAQIREELLSALSTYPQG